MHDTAGAVEMMKAAIQAAHVDFVNAIHELRDATVHGIKSQAAETRGALQKVKSAQGH